MKKINVLVVGATGYVGEELVRLLLNHPNVCLKGITSQSYVDKEYSEVFRNFVNIYPERCQKQDIAKFSEEVDVIFFALPHGITSGLIDDLLLKKVKVIDLGADFRLQDVNVYQEWYKTEHLSTDVLKEAVYGLSELNREKIKKSRIVGNPGCYTTASILALSPLLAANLIDEKSIIINGASGITGAGRKPDATTHYTECNESYKAYGIANHRHTPEIEEQLSYVAKKPIVVNFTPHLLPMNRGILVTAYANLSKQYSYEEIKKKYQNYYKGEQFIRLLKENSYPETNLVKGSNYCDINFKIDQRTKRIIVISSIDNLVKGAAGQAIQNMNLMFGLAENSGLKIIPMFL